MNGEGHVFALQKIVKRGCLPASLLYMIVGDVLEDMLEDSQYEVEGLILSNGKNVKRNVIYW